MADRQEERARKHRWLQAELRGIAGDGPIDWVEGRARIGYRNRIRLRIASDGSVAFFNPEKSRDCAVLEPRLREAMRRVVACGASRPGALVPLAHVEVRTFDATGRPSAFFVPRRIEEPLPRETQVALAALAAEGFVVHVHRARASRVPAQRYPIAGPWFADVPLGAFMQVNTEVNRLLVERILTTAARAGAESFADLFAGSGNFSIPLAGAGLSGVAVEQSTSSIRALDELRVEQSLSIDAVAGDAIEYAARCAAQGRHFDLTIVDAPRAGIKQGHDRIAAISRSTLAVCSCSPKTFARDVGFFLQNGFRLESVTGFDMFPGTRHVELLGVLGRDALP